MIYKRFKTCFVISLGNKAYKEIKKDSFLLLSLIMILVVFDSRCFFSTVEDCHFVVAICSFDSTIIRKSYHHEPIDLSRRKDDEYRVIERPMLAICLSGTPGQLYTLTPQAEDGTFSRITCYHMPFKAEFRDVLVESANTNSDSYTLRDRFFQLGWQYKQRREAFFRGGK